MGLSKWLTTSEFLKQYLIEFGNSNKNALKICLNLLYLLNISFLHIRMKYLNHQSDQNYN